LPRNIKLPVLPDPNLPPPPPPISEPKTIIANYQPKSLVSEIPSKNQEKFSLNIISKKTEISEQLPLITSEREQPTEKEQVLLAKIKQLEQRLAQFQVENNNLKAENKHLKVLIGQDQETEAKVIQPLPFKPNK
jgi:hypothetical protein